MTTVSATVGKGNVGKGFLIGSIVSVHAIGNPVIWEHIKGRIQNPNDGLSCNVGNIVGNSAAIGKACIIACQKTHPFTRVGKRWRDAGVEPQQVRNRTLLVRYASGTNRCSVKHERR